MGWSGKRELIKRKSARTLQELLDMRPKLQPINIEKIHLENIMLALEGLTFSKDVSERIIGSRKKLFELISKGEIRAYKGKNVQNSKWQCNAADVMRHCRNMRKSVNSIKVREDLI